MTRKDLNALLRPRSIALVGVSREAASSRTMSGGTILASLERFGFAGRIDVVHPSGGVVAGRPSAKSIAVLPDAADLIVLALPAASVPAVIDEAGARGIRAAAVLSAGFSEAGTEEGERLGRELAGAAARHGVALCGPNGLGYLNVADRVLAGYFPCLLGDASPRLGGLSIVTQSGAVGNSLLARAMDRGIGVSFVISSGNETNVSIADYVRFLVADARTLVIALYLEGIAGAADGAAFRAALADAAAAAKPVVVYKVGRSACGAKAALSHTAKLAGEPALYRGLFKQLGAIEVEHLDDLIELPMLMLKLGAGGSVAQAAPPRGIGVVSISGGLGAIVADHFSAAGFELPELQAQTRARLAALPVALGSTVNPVDTTAAIQRQEERLADILAIVAEDPGIDAIVFPNAARFPDAALNVAGLMARTAEQLPKPLLSLWYAGAENDAAMALLHASERVPCFDDPAAAARALAAWRRHRAFSRADGAHRALVMRDALHAPPANAPGVPRRVLNEVQAKRVLHEFGLRLPPEAAIAPGAGAPAAAVAAALGIGFPVAAKVISADIAHKARIGGVQLNIGDPRALEHAVVSLLGGVGLQAPAARIEGVLVSAMQPIVLELLVGVVRDAQFGLALMVGSGGSAVEQQAQIAMRLLPASRADCEEALAELPERRLRLASASERAALVDAIESVGCAAWAHRATLLELEVNPLVLTVDGRVLALDALMSLGEAA